MEPPGLGLWSWEKQSKKTLLTLTVLRTCEGVIYEAGSQLDQMGICLNLTLDFLVFRTLRNELLLFLTLQPLGFCYSSPHGSRL